MTLTNATANPAYIFLTAYMGPGDGTRQNALQYQSATSLTAAVSNVVIQEVAAGLTNQAYNLTTMFGSQVSATLIAISDGTNPGTGFNITATSGMNKWQVAPNGVFLVMPLSTFTLPTVYIDNPSATSVLNLAFSLLGS